MFPIKSVVNFGIPFVTTDNVSSCDPFNMQKLAILRNRRKRPNLGDSSTSLNKRRNTSNADLLPSAESAAPMTAGPSSASTPALLSNPTAIQSTATVIHTPAANASTRSVAVGPSTPPSTSSPSPKLNFFQKFTRKASRTFKKNRPAARTGNNDSSSSSGSSSGGYDAMTADTSVEPTPTRGGALRSSTIPEVAITPTSDSSRSASPAASIRTVFRVNPYTGRPAQQYDIHFLSPRTAAAAAKARRNRARSPRPIPVGRRGVASAASTPTASGSFPPTRAPTTVVASSSLPAGFPTRSSSLRHSNEFPFSASAADLRADDSDLYHNGSGPSTPVKEAHKAEVPASSPTLPGSAGSNYSLNKPLPGLPQEEVSAVAELQPLSPAPSASDDVFYDASPVSTVSSATIAGGSSSPKTPEQATVSAAAASRISLTGFPTPPTTTGHQQAFMHRLPPTPVTQPVPSNSPAFGFSSPVLPEVGGDSYTIPPTPTPARATLATVVSGGGRTIEHQSFSSPTYRLFPHQVDNRVLEARLNQIRAPVSGGGGVDNASGEGEDENGGNSSADADAVMNDSFMLNADSDDDDGDMEPLISSSPLQCNRESFTSVLTQTTGMSFVTAAEDVEMEDVEIDEEEMNDSSLVDVDGSTLVAEGAAELSSDHQMLLSRSSTPDVENVGSDDSYVHVGDSTLDGTTLVAEVEPEPSFVANMNVDEEEAAVEPEPATFQIVAKDGADTGVAVQPGDGPPINLTEKQQGKIQWLPNYTPVPDPHWVEDPDVANIRTIVAAHIHLVGLDKDDFQVEYFAEGSFNKLYTVRKASLPPDTGPEYIFRVCLPAYPWYKLESEIATMELVRMYTSIPVPQVYVYDSNSDNPVGHEWMMMNKVKGVAFIDARENMTMEQKIKIAETLADWMHQLSLLRFDKIGSIYRRRLKPATSKDDFKVGPIIEQTFMADWRLEYNLHRGPYTSIEQYFGALVDVNLADVIDPRQRARSEFCAALKEFDWLTTNPDDCDDSDDRELVEKAHEKFASQPPESKQARIDQLRAEIESYRAQNDEETSSVVHSRPRYELVDLNGDRLPDPFGPMAAQCQALRSVLPHLCPPHALGPASTVLHHWDMSGNNILVDAAGNPVALIDWEQVQTLPFDLIEPYPSAIFDDYDFEEPPRKPPPNAPKVMHTTYTANYELYVNYQLRKAFRERLEVLRSPHLEAFKEKKPDLGELLTLARDADRDFIDEDVAELVGKVKEEIGFGF
ncbi:Aminoglycoside phosphotransferase [Lasiodiplodia theobromae]|uniref:Aminoglycoside phosphotransferase n=1 Tax=Lasiodiplodia theobromae TaxID=45133 RepID=UPI0015C2FCB2|nr:Aminoglycoside phosphotransferase [Lasiodiplodia theobromae]KAF4546233.1 Aminoglycoside phosphotransferase [Lasiodiplodia theobromae]